MQISTFLENFAEPVADDSPTISGPVISYAEAESQKLESFETGYKAGWDDAAAAQKEDVDRLSSELAQNLQDLSFTYQEAYSHVQNAMSPLLEEIVRVLLPGLIEDALGEQLLKHLKELSEEIGQIPVMISVHPDCVSNITPIVEGDFAFPIDVVGDATLETAQSEIKFGEQAKQIDLSEILQSVKETVEGFIHDTKRTMSNG